MDPIVEARRHWVDHGWDATAGGMAVVTSIMRAQQILLGRVDRALKPYALTFARYELLMLLSFSRTGRLPMSVVGSRLQVHPTSVTNAVDRLQAAGLVRREPHPEDRRVTLVALTDEGAAIAAKATDALNAEVFADVGVSDAQGGRVVAALTALRRHAGDLSTP